MPVLPTDELSADPMLPTERSQQNQQRHRALQYADQPRLAQTLPQSDAAVVVTALAQPEQFHGDVSTNSACEVRSTEFPSGHAAPVESRRLLKVAAQCAMLPPAGDLNVVPSNANVQAIVCTTASCKQSNPE